MQAYDILKDEYPAQIYFEVLKEVLKIPLVRDLARMALSSLQSDVERMVQCERKIEPNATSREIHEQARRPLVNNLLGKW